MYKYKQTTDVEVGDLVVWTNPASCSTIANKPYKVISTDNTLVRIKDENNNTRYYGNVSRKTLFTKPADQAVVGDYMYRVSSGGTKFPQHSVMKIKEVHRDVLDYAKGFGVQFCEVIVIAQADPSLVQQAPTIPESAISFALYPSGAPSEPTQPTIKEQPMNKTTLKLLLELLSASEEVKDVTNSKFVGIITNEDEYVGYMYFDSKENATEYMAQPKMELHKLHLFEKSCVLAQKPRKVIEV